MVRMVMWLGVNGQIKSPDVTNKSNARIVVCGLCGLEEESLSRIMERRLPMKSEEFGSKRMAALSVFEKLRVSIYQEFTKSIGEINEERILLKTVQALDARRKLISLVEGNDIDVTIIGKEKT